MSVQSFADIGNSGAVDMVVRIHDLSLGGCLIEAPVAVMLGRRITLRLDLPGDDWFSLQGETVRVATQSKFAIRFLDMDGAKEDRLQRVINRFIAASPAAGSTLDGAADVG